MSRSFRLAWLIGALLVCWPLAAQKLGQESTSSKTRASESRAGGDAPLSKPGSVLDVIKLKATVDKVDLEKRTVTFKDGKKGGETIELGFPQPSGREQIKVSKKAAKSLGKKKLRLEELKPGTEVKLQYYPMLTQVMEVLVE